MPGSTRLGAATKYSLPKAIYRNRAGMELKGPDGSVVYKLVKNEHWADKHCVTDPKGNKLALLRRDITFPVAQLRFIVPSMPPKYEYLLFKTNDLLKPELNSTINSVCSSRKRGTMTDMKDQLMLRFEEFITGKEGAGYIDVEVAAGIDPLQAVIIGISIDEETTRSR